MSVLDAFQPVKPYAVCVDSDGCAMDTMNIKHFRCFGPCMVTEWQLEQWAQPILDRWNVINLFSLTRGINRFKGLAMALAEINDQYTPIDGISELVDWAKHAPELSNVAVEKEIPRHPIFAKALSWSKEVNRTIKLLPQSEVKPFEHVGDALALAHEQADVIVVSSANPEAVREEWQRFGLMEHVDLVCAQDQGSKAYCISRLVEKGYQRILMCGDAPGDEKAATVNQVGFYPILVNHEAESWQLFIDESLGKFICGELDSAYQQKLLDNFKQNLNA